MSGQATADFSLKAGNVEVVELAVSGRVDLGTPRTITFLVWKGDLGLVGGNRFANGGLVHLRHGRHVNTRLTLEVYGQLNYDEPLLVEFRGLVGGGVRTALTSGRHAQLSLGAGYMFEHERLDLPITAVHPRRTSLHRLSSYVAVRLGRGSRITAVSTAYVQPQLDDWGDVRVLHNARLAVEMTRALSLTLSAAFRYDSGPPDGLHRADLALTSGVAVTF